MYPYDEIVFENNVFRHISNRNITRGGRLTTTSVQQNVFLTQDEKMDGPIEQIRILKVQNKTMLYVFVI